MHIYCTRKNTRICQKIKSAEELLVSLIDLYFPSPKAAKSHYVKKLTNTGDLHIQY